MRFKKLNKNAITPNRANQNDAGYDLYSSSEDNIPILPGCRSVVSTGIAMEIPENVVGLIWPRSGLATKQGIDVLAGVIDSSYRGEIKVCLLNTSNDSVLIRSGDKIAQIVFQPYLTYAFEEVELLTDTSRGEKGFGSSG